MQPFGHAVTKSLLKSSGLIIISLLLSACGPGRGSQPDFSVISSPQVPVLAGTSPQTEPPTVIPTDTPEPAIEQPSSTPTGPTIFTMSPTQIPTSTPTPIPSDTPQPEPTPTFTPEPVTEAATQPPPPPQVSTPPDEPRKGGSWDMEGGFEIWLNPHGDNCSGSKVAVGWQGFTSRGEYGSSCFYLNEYGPNVFSGRYSQQVTFDFADSTAGLYRVIDTQPGHRYQVTAHLRHVHTLPAMQFAFGYDLSGGQDWQANTVQWAPWDEFREDEWIAHEETITASGSQTTIFIRGTHPTAAQGGATYIDAIEVIDLGQ